MSWADEYQALRKKRKKDDDDSEEKKSGNSWEDQYMELRENRSNTNASTTVTIPAPTPRKKEKDGWFQGGAFEDGYQFGDLTNTLLGTKKDIQENLLAGILGIGEKAVDAGAYLVGGVGGLFGADDFKEDVGDFIKKDLYDEEAIAKKIIGYSPDSIQANILGVNSETDSVLAAKSDALTQSGGQLIGTIGLQAAGVPWFVTSGVTSFGSEAEGALNEGATYGEAGLSAAISAGAEIFTEKLFGGSGLGEEGLINLEPLTKGISSKLVKALADYGLDMAAEGAEEVVSDFAGNLASSLYKEENLGELLFSEEAVEGYIDSFIGGGVLGGVMNVGKVTNSIQTGKDYRTDLTTNEQKVFDKVYNDLVAEAEKNGKLTRKQKAEIYDEVLSKMEKGYIDIETIEEALGGDTYKSYKDTMDSEDAIKTEFETLNKMKQGDMTGEQVDRRNELKQQLEEIKSNSQRDNLKQQLGDEVFSLVKDSRLAESYNERARRSQAFEADMGQYDAKQQEVIKKAVESGVLNNTNRTHEFVDLIAKISADKGVLFDFTSNEKLKDSGFAVDGKQVNGYVTKDGITLNIHSAKALNSVVGHEITHVLEGTELYNALQNSIVEYAKSKGDYQGRYDALPKLYANVKDANIDAELTADLVGDYLFTDENFIRNLSTQNRNVFQKVYDEIKYLVKVATAGSKEARELEKVKRAFEKAYKETGKAQNDGEATIDPENDADLDYESPAKYSMSVTDPDTIDFLDNQEHITTYKAMVLIDGKLYPPMASKVKGEDGKYRMTNPRELGEWQQATEDTTNIKFNDKGIGYYDLKKDDGGTVRAAYNPYEHSSNLVLNDQFEAAYKRDNLVAVECVIPVSEMSSGYKAQYAKDSVGVMDWHSGVVAGKLQDNKRMVYLSRYLKVTRILSDAETAAKYKEIVGDTPVPFNVVSPGLLAELEKAGVNIDYEGSPQYQYQQRKAAEREKTKYSISDTDGKQLSKGQQEYFKDSKLRDENGNLKVMYHGSQDAGFHTFEGKRSDDGISFFFVDRNDVAASYSGTSETYEARTIRTTEDMNRFLAEIGYDHYQAVERNGKVELLENNEHVATKDTAKEIYEEFCWYEGVGEGDANYKVYLNLQNPLEVDAEGRNWDNVTREFSQEIYDKYKSLTEEEKAALHNLAGWGEVREFWREINRAADRFESQGGGDGYTRNLASAYNKLLEGDNPVNKYDLFSIAEDNFSEESLQAFAVKQMNTRDYAQRAKEQGYDGVIFNNIVDVGGYGNGSEGAATVAIAFDSNQIKSVANENPTKDADIRYSLSDSNGKKLTNAQQAYFKDSKARDDDGNLKVVYHGTRNADFTVFKRNVNFFTDSKEVADSYAPTGDMYEGYVNITKPYEIDAAGEKWSKIPVDDATKKFLQGYGASVFKEGGKWRTTPADLAAAIEEAVDNGDMDYDGIIIKNVDDTGSYYKGNSTNLATDYIVFNSNQFKNADNLKPSADPDIRFSLSEPVEQTNELIAVHNLKSSELLKSMELGGLPSPSIAVIKAQQGHDKYGEVSLIFPKEAIDPKASRDNKVYGGDAWTPTYPKIEYKPSKAVEEKVHDKYYELAKTIGYDNAKPLYRYVYEMEDSLNREGGEAGLLEKLYADTDMMQVYLQDIGKAKVEPVVKETTTKISEAEAEMNQFMVDALGVDMLSEFAVKPGENPMRRRKEFIEQHEDVILDAYERLCKEVYGFTDTETNNVLEQTGRKDLMRFIRNAYMYTKNNGVTVKTETDYAATKEAIRSAAQDGYKEWVDNLFGGVEEKSGIRNNADYYTPAGNPRKWDALHWENTLENVVKVMKQQNQTGADAMFGVNQLFSAAAKDYKSIADIKADSDRLYTQNAEEYEAAKESYVARFSAIAGRIMDKRNSNEFIAQENAMECIIDAVRSYKSAAGIFKDLKQYPQLTVTQKDVADIVSLVTDISNMPTGYFEAKPMRAVGFDEVGVFVIPNNADVKLKQELLNRGYSIAEYDPNVEGDRQKVVNQFEQYKFSLSDVGAQQNAYNQQMEYATVAENATVAPEVGVSKNETTTIDTELFPDDLAPTAAELEKLYDEKAAIEVRLAPFTAMPESEWEAHSDEITNAVTEYNTVMGRIAELETDEADRVNSLDDADAPQEVEAPIYSDDNVTVDNPFKGRDWYSVGKRNVKAYMYENPEVKPFFQEEAMILGAELNNTTRGERWYNDELYYESGGEKGFGGTKRHTSESMEELLDSWHMSYADIEKGLNAIIEDNGAENIAAAKKLEFMLNDRLLKGYKDFFTGKMIPPNQDYINMLNEKQINAYSKEAFDALMAEANQYLQEDIAPVETFDTADNLQVTGQQAFISDAPVSQAPVKEAPAESHPAEVAKKTGEKKAKTAKILTEEPKIKKKGRLGMMLRKNLVDDFSVFEDLDIKKKRNRELQAKASFMRSAENRAQWLIGNGTHGVKSLNDIKTEVEASGKTKAFYEYVYHKHNISRMSLETEENRIKREGLQERFKGYTDKQIRDIATEWIKKDTPADVRERIKAARAFIEAKQGANKPVFGYDVTADVSREAVKRYEAANPEFKDYARDVYKYMGHLRNLLVENDIISKETAELWERMYPYFVPIRRDTETGLNINVPLDSRKTGVNAPVKRAKGGNSDILPLFDTMAMRTEQTFRAIARNNFGLELKDTLGTVISREDASNDIDDTFEGMDSHEELLQKGKDGQNPTFTVFENGKRVTFEITEDMYDALKPKSEGLSYRNKVLGKLSELQRGLLTQYSPMFILKNALKDPQDLLLNSQHPAKTYANFPVAYKEILSKGKWYTEYVESGGEHNTYFDRQTNTFTENVGGVKRVITMPLKAIDAVSNVIEMAPRLAEYMASRKEGRSIEVSMLDAARVTTDFSAGGDVTKFFNRNGATFLNASVQGAAQVVRNVREAKAQGMKGWTKLAAKTIIAGLPALILNHLLWDDDEEYEELSDYVKRDYYVVGKLDDGTFIRIPKGRTVSVIQNALQQMDNLVTGDDEADFGAFFELVISNLAPNNPLDNNIFAPLIQTFVTEKTWYGEDLIPSRLQDLPAAEQYDESTDSISKWLGEKLNFISPYKINYLMNQYSGGIGDMFMPMLTPEAEGGDDSFLGNVIAPMKDVFTTNVTMNNQNVSDFYDTMDKLKVNSNSMYATDEDLLKYKYMNAVNAELSELYQQKREIQNSDLSDAEKYEQVIEIQEQIVDMMREGLGNYDSVRIQGGNYARIGGYHFDKDEDGKWWKINEEQLEKQNEVTAALGITPSEYWSNRTEYNFAYEKPEQYALSQAVGGYESYKSYTSDLWDISADKDENGKSIPYSRKEKVIDWLNELDADYGIKIILFKNEYNADDTYNYDIIEYLNSREDISYQQMETILKYLGFEVDSKGNITWD